MQGLLAFTGILLVLALSGLIYQWAATRVEARAYPPPGKLYQVRISLEEKSEIALQMHLYCQGSQKAGSPVVILESHNGGTVSNWSWVQPELAKSTRVCAYDRDGLGWSDLAPQPLDTRQNALALHALLHAAGVPAPYVLVGHSLGGLYTRAYADRYPEEVAGMALIEATDPNLFQVQGKPDAMPGAEPLMMEIAPFYARFGLVRLASMFTGDPDLPAKQQAETSAFYKTTKFYQTLNRQYHLFPTLLAQVRESGDLGSIPLAIIVGSEGDGGNELHMRLFNQQAALSVNHVVCMVEGAGHISLVDREDHAVQTNAAILQVLEAAVTGEPVTCAP